MVITDSFEDFDVAVDYWKGDLPESKYSEKKETDDKVSKFVKEEIQKIDIPRINNRHGQFVKPLQDEVWRKHTARMCMAPSKAEASGDLERDYNGRVSGKISARLVWEFKNEDSESPDSVNENREDQTRNDPPDHYERSRES